MLFEVFSDNTTGVVTSVSNNSILIEEGNYICNLETKQGVLEYSLYSIDDAVYVISPSTYTPTLMYGLEVARNCIITELIEVLEEAADIDIRHIQLLADSMTSGGVKSV